MLELEILTLNHIHRVMTSTEEVHGMTYALPSEVGAAAGAGKLLRLDETGNVTTAGDLVFTSNLKITGYLTVQGGLIQDDTGDDDFSIVTNGGMIVMLDKDNDGTASKFQVRTNNATTNLFEIDELGNVIILGELYVKGNKTQIDAENVTVTDNVITLNAGEVGNGVTLQYAGIEVDRGKSGTTPNGKAVLRFNETTDKWEWSADSSTFQNVPDDALLVHLAGAETVTGVKTFADGQVFDTINLNSAKFRSDNTGMWLARAHGTKGTIGFGWDNTALRFGVYFAGAEKTTFDESGLLRTAAVKLYGAAAKLSAEDDNAALTLEANGTGVVYIQKGATGNVDFLNGKVVMTSAGALTAASTIQSNNGTFQNSNAESMVLNNGATLTTKGGVVLMIDSDANDTGSVLVIRADAGTTDLFKVDQNGAVETASSVVIKTGKGAVSLTIGDGNTASYATGEASAQVRLNGTGLRHADILYNPKDATVILTGTGSAIGDQSMHLKVNGNFTAVGDLAVEGGDITGKTGANLRVFGDTGLLLASNGGVVIMLDENNDATNSAFIVRKDNSGTALFVVNENGLVEFYGNMQSNASRSIDLKNTTDTTLTITNSDTGIAHLVVEGNGTFNGGTLNVVSATNRAIVNLNTNSGTDAAVDVAIGVVGDNFYLFEPEDTSTGAGITQVMDGTTPLGRQWLAITDDGDLDYTAGGTMKVKGDPVATKGMMKRATLTIATGQTAVTWAHNLGSTAYTVAIAATSVSRHVAYRSKAANAIEFFIDDPDIAAIDIDVILMGF